MYITSEPLVRDIARTAQNVVQELERQICFDEYIAMPSFGANVILRFRYTGTAPVNLALLNAMETKMRKAAGARYLVNLDGAAYKACGLIYDRLPATLKAIHARADCPIPHCRFHADGLENDWQRICRLFQLPSNTPLWEIQANGNRLLALALSAHDGAPVRESICTDGKQIQYLFFERRRFTHRNDESPVPGVPAKRIHLPGADGISGAIQLTQAAEKIVLPIRLAPPSHRSSGRAQPIPRSRRAP